MQQSPPTDPLFTSPQGERLDYHNFARRVFKPACQRAGLEGITLHSLQRTHATMLITSGANAKAVQHRMGHASIQTTLKHYATSTDDDRTAAASAKAEYLKSVASDDTTGSSAATAPQGGSK